MNIFVLLIPNVKERKSDCEFETDFKKSFCGLFIVSNDDIISAYVGVKTDVENNICLVRNKILGTERCTPTKNS